MPGKSKRSKRKYYQPTKKPVSGQQHAAATAQPAAATSQPAAVTPSAARTSAPAAPKAATYPYITTELRNIGILTGIILVILVILAVIIT